MANQANPVTNLDSVNLGSDQVNSLLIKGGASGSPPSLQAVGSDTNIDLELVPKGTGAVNVQATTATTATAGSIVPTDFVGFIEIKLNGTLVKIPYYSV